MVRCPCERSVEFPPGFLQRRYRLASDTLVFDLQFRLRCEGCNARAGFRITIFDERTCGIMRSRGWSGWLWRGSEALVLRIIRIRQKVLSAPAMSNSIIVWDLETVPDLRGYAAANDMSASTDDEVREAIGDKFPKHIYHSIVCIGALVAHRDNGAWVVDALGAPHVGDRTEKQLITAFVDRIAELSPQLVTFNGNSFDLPVLRYRAMINEVPAPGLSARSYFNRYSDDALDLCDALSSFSMQGKATLHEICKVMALPGKPDSIDGGEVHRYFQDGKIQEIADYCETDIVNTYRVWLRYELFRGRLSPTDFEASEQGLAAFLKGKEDTKPHLIGMAG